MRRFGRAVSALRTPTKPPGPTRLRPLDDTSQPSERPLWTKETAAPRAEDRPDGPPPAPEPIEGVGRPETYGTLWTYSGHRSWWQRFRGLFSGPDGRATTPPPPPPAPPGAKNIARPTPLNPDVGGVVRMPTEPSEPLTADDMPQGFRAAEQAEVPEWAKLAEFKRVEVGPDDVVVVRLGDPSITYLSAEALKQIGDEARAMFPDSRVVVSTLAADVSVEDRRTAALIEMTEVAREGFAAFTSAASAAQTVSSSIPATPAVLEAIGKAAAKREHIYVLASSFEHAESFARDWARARPGSRRLSDCVDLLTDRCLTVNPDDGPVIRLAGCERRHGFETAMRTLKRHGVEVKCAEEVAACAL